MRSKPRSQSAADLRQLLLSGHVVRRAYGRAWFSFLWSLCMSAFIYTGSMEFVTVNLLVSAFNPFATLMLAMMMGTRHLFYGLSMLERFKNMGRKNRT